MRRSWMLVKPLGIIRVSICDGARADGYNISAGYTIFNYKWDGIVVYGSIVRIEIG